MVLNDILTLVKAGYTREEITQMEQQETPNANPEPVPVAVAEPAQNPEPSSPQVVEPVPTAAPVAQPQPIPTQAQAEPTMAELMQAVAKLTSAVQANAIAQSVIPGGLTQPAPTAEDMLAEIIRPTFKAREDR